YARTLSRMEEQASDVEVAMLELDAAVPATAFRHVLHTANVGPVLLLQYARLIARHFNAEARHTERIEALIQRILALPKLDGSRELRSRADTQQALEYIVRESHATPSLKQAALEFIARGAERVAAIEKIDEVFDGGFYLDVLGYRVSLRDSLLDV